MKKFSLKLNSRSVHRGLVLYSLLVITLIFVVQYAIWASKNTEALSVVTSQGVWCRGEDSDPIPGYAGLEKGECLVPSDRDDLYNFDQCADGSQTGIVNVCESIDADGNCVNPQQVDTIDPGVGASCIDLAKQYGAATQIVVQCQDQKTASSIKSIGSVSCNGPVVSKATAAINSNSNTSTIPAGTLAANYQGIQYTYWETNGSKCDIQFKQSEGTVCLVVENDFDYELGQKHWCDTENWINGGCNCPVGATCDSDHFSATGSKIKPGHYDPDGANGAFCRPYYNGFLGKECYQLKGSDKYYNEVWTRVFNKPDVQVVCLDRNKQDPSETYCGMQQIDFTNNVGTLGCGIGGLMADVTECGPPITTPPITTPPITTPPVTTPPVTTPPVTTPPITTPPVQQAQCTTFNSSPASYVQGSGNISVSLTAYVNDPSDQIGSVQFFAIADTDSRCIGANWTSVGTDTVPTSNQAYNVQFNSAIVPGFGQSTKIEYHANLFNTQGQLICTGNPGNDGNGCNNGLPKCTVPVFNTLTCNDEIPVVSITNTPTLTPTVTPSFPTASPPPTVTITPPVTTPPVTTPPVTTPPVTTPPVTTPPVTTPPPISKLIGGKAVCQESDRSPEFPVQNASIVLYDQNGNSFIAYTDQFGNFSQVIPLNSNNGSYTNQIGVYLLNVDSNGVLATGQSHLSMHPPVQPVPANFANYCAFDDFNSDGLDDQTYCSVNSGLPSCGNSSLSGAGSYANCGVNNQINNYNQFYFRFSNCSPTVITITPSATPMPTPTINPGQSIDVQKVVETNRTYTIGELVTFRITITNTGSETLTVVEFEDTYNPARLDFLRILNGTTGENITSEFSNSVLGHLDENLGIISHQDLTVINGLGGDLSPGESIILEIDYIALDSTCNNAEVIGQNEDGDEVMDSDKDCITVTSDTPVTDK